MFLIPSLKFIEKYYLYPGSCYKTYEYEEGLKCATKYLQRKKEQSLKIPQDRHTQVNCTVSFTILSNVYKLASIFLAIIT